MTSLRRLLVRASLLAFGCACLGAGCSTPAEQLPLANLEQWPTLECDPLVPDVCGFPYPNNVFTRADDTTPTGLRLALSQQSMPTSKDGKLTDPTVFNVSDGFSPGISLAAFLPGASNTGLPTPLTIDASLSPQSPTIVLDADTGELVPHYADLDRSHEDPDQRALLIRPALRLRDGQRYIVAMRAIENAAGDVLPASVAFQTLQDGSTDEALGGETRLRLHKEIVGLLDAAGVPTDDLQLAWDFTTASQANNNGWMVHMRDEALALVGAEGPTLTIDSADTDFATEHIAFRIKGTFDVPLYLDQPDPGGQLLFGEDGMPEPNPDTPTVAVQFEALIPQSALTEPAALVQYGHGLLGRHTQIESGHFLSFLNEYNYIFFAVDLAGMASEDEAYIAAQLFTGKLEALDGMFDRLHQGTLNNLLAMRMMSTRFAAHPDYGSYVDPSQRHYHGISQGGIFGGVYMALSTDVARGALGVPGQSYNLLLNRSVDFDPFFAIFNVAYPDAREQQLALAHLQQLWDRVEPTGYTTHISDNRLPDTPAKQVLLRAAIGDHQVSTLGAHVMARAMNASHIDTGLRAIWGLPSAATSDSVGYVEYDFGLPAEPLCNVPVRDCEDPHGKLRKLEAARQQLDHFFRSGEIKNFCDNGSCSYPDQSGCDINPPATTDPCAEP